MAKRRRSQPMKVEGDPAPVDTDDDVGLAVLTTPSRPPPATKEDSPMTTASKKTEPTVTPIDRAPEITCDRYVGNKQSLGVAFKAEATINDKFRIVKRTRAEWDKLWDVFLKAPR